MTAAAPRLLSCPPPAGFVPAGDVFEARVEAAAPEFANRKRRTGRRRVGILYEAAAQEYLQARYGDAYIPSPWLRFRSDRGWRWCQPDGLLLQVDRLRVVVVEVKYQHTSDAWWQTERLYKPVLRKLFDPSWSFDSCEVVKWYDCARVFPNRPLLCEDVAAVPAGEYGVHIYRPIKGGRRG